MKLYFSAGSCSLAPHIVLQELGLKFETEAVNLKTKQTASGKYFTTINPKGSVPTLQLDDGQMLTEGAVIMQYLSDQKPESQLMPKSGTLERYRAQEWLNYIATELHKGISPLWNPKTPEDFKTIVMERITKQFDYVAEQLKGKTYLMGNTFTAPDAYLFTILSWTPYLKLDLTKWPSLLAYVEKVKSRPATLAALKAEGLLK